LNPRICSFFSLSNLHSLPDLFPSPLSFRGVERERDNEEPLAFAQGRLRCSARWPNHLFDGSSQWTGLPPGFLRHLICSKFVPGWTGRGTN
jgi:hypothetical protein